jgi:hypothetical protein
MDGFLEWPSAPRGISHHRSRNVMPDQAAFRRPNRYFRSVRVQLSFMAAISAITARCHSGSGGFPVLHSGKLVPRLTCSQASTSVVSSFAMSRNCVSASGPRTSSSGVSGLWTAVMIAWAALAGSPGC